MKPQACVTVDRHAVAVFVRAECSSLVIGLNIVTGNVTVRTSFMLHYMYMPDCKACL